MIPKYKVGDVVQIVPTPYKDCPFSWADDMDEWCGRTVVITDCRYSGAYSAYLYYIELHQSESERGFPRRFRDRGPGAKTVSSRLGPTPRLRILKFLKLMICSEVIGDGVRT